MATLLLDDRYVVISVQVDPELRPIAKAAAKPHGGVRRNGAPAADDVGDAAGRHTEVEREPIGAETAGRDLSSQQPAWMRNGSLASRGIAP